MTGDAKDIVARFDRLRTERSPWENQWDAIRRVIYPTGAPITATETPGTNTHATLYDTTGELALDAATDGLHAMLTNPATDWLDLEMEGVEESFGTGQYLESLERHLLRTVFANPASGFYMALPAVYREDLAYGNACLWIGDVPGAVPIFQPIPMRQMFWSENHEGRIDTFFRCFPLTARAAAERFAAGGRLPELVLKEAADAARQENIHEFLHCVYPRRSVNAEEGRYAAHPRRRTYASKWVHLASKTEIDERGYGTLPFIAVRNNPRPGEAYGRGQGARTYPDVQMIQREEKSIIRAMEKIADPPMMVADDGLRSRPSLVAGSYTVVRAEYMYDGRLPMRPIQSGGRPELAEEHAERRRMRIREAFLRNLMELPRDPKMTATQFLGLQEEQLRGLSPWIGRYENQMLGPIVERVLEIEKRRGALPPAPANLSAIDYRARFVSPVARLQKVAQLRAIMQLFEVMHAIGTVIGAQIPGADKIDVDAVWDEVRDTLGVTRRIYLAPAALKAARKAADEIAQQRAQIEMGKEASVIPKNLAPLLAIAQQQGQGGAALPAPANANAAPAEEAA